MKNVETLVARLVAADRGRALPIRATSALSPDPDNAIGIAAVRVVTEEQVQALAYGELDAPPQTLTRVHPLSRDTRDLAPFADWLVDHVQRSVDTNQHVRLWVPHNNTIETLDILGRRYENNPHASSTLQEAARFCRILAEESRFAGQQTVAIARDTLLIHVVTGQMPIEDLHLGAVLAWVTPQPGRDTREAAIERARWPASGTLINTPDRRDDDCIEQLRKQFKRASASDRTQIADDIRRILTRSVAREWELLIAARTAFWGLGLPPANVDELCRSSGKRVAWAVNNFLSSPKQAVPVTRKLDELEHALQQSTSADMHSDTVVRRRAARLGHVVHGIVQTVDQPRPNFKPCYLLLRTPQDNLRVRPDDRVARVGNAIQGIVREISPGPSSTTDIRIELKNGVRGASSMLGQRQQWIGDKSFPPFLRRKALNEARSRNAWMVDGTPPPADRPTSLGGSDPLHLAQQARKTP